MPRLRGFQGPRRAGNVCPLCLYHPIYLHEVFRTFLEPHSLPDRLITQQYSSDIKCSLILLNAKFCGITLVPSSSLRITFLKQKNEPLSISACADYASYPLRMQLVQLRYRAKPGQKICSVSHTEMGALHGCPIIKQLVSPAHSHNQTQSYHLTYL